MKCPTCASKAAVTSTRTVEPGVLRRQHKCLQCRGTFATVETTMDRYGRMPGEPKPPPEVRKPLTSDVNILARVLVGMEEDETRLQRLYGDANPRSPRAADKRLAEALRRVVDTLKGKT